MDFHVPKQRAEDIKKKITFEKRSNNTSSLQPPRNILHLTSEYGGGLKSILAVITPR